MDLNTSLILTFIVDNDKGIWVGIGPLFLAPFGRPHLYYGYSLSGFYKKSTTKVVLVRYLWL
jgi:hypothetical protein